jgi:hypothetical protein
MTQAEVPLDTPPEPKQAHGKHRKARKEAAAMAKSKKRDVKRKGLRLLRQASRNLLVEKVRKTRADAKVVAIRQQPPKLRGEEQEPGGILFGMRTGLLGHPTTTVLKVPDEKLVGCMEEDKNEARKELTELVTQVGLLTLAALFNYNLAWGPDGLAKAIVKWAGIDVEALRKAAEAEAADEAAKAPEEQLAEQPEAPVEVEQVDIGGEG